MTTTTADIGYKEAAAAADAYRDATTKIAKIEATLAQEQAKLASKYEPDMIAAKEAQAEATATLERYLNDNKDNLLQGSARSFYLAGVKIGYRKAKARIVCVGKVTWDKVLHFLKGSAELTEKYVVSKEDIDKNALAKADEKFLKELGVKLEQEDTFFASL